MTTSIKPTPTPVRWYYPQRPSPGVNSVNAHLSESFVRYASDKNFGFEPKLNDTRVIIALCPAVTVGKHLYVFEDGIGFFNRHGEPLSYGPNDFPDLYDKLKQHQQSIKELGDEDGANRYFILDGLLMLRRTTIFRGVFFLMDSWLVGGQELFDVPLLDRKKILKLFPAVPAFSGSDAPIQFIDIKPCGNIEEVQSFWLQLQEFNRQRSEASPAFEGIVVKRLDSGYDRNFRDGQESRNWIKMKFIF